MRTIAIVLIALFVLVACSSGNNAASASAEEQKKAGEATAEPKPDPENQKPPDRATAVFETTVGELRCTLFGKETPLTVANFIGLAEGTKSWKHPVTKRKLENTPLYNGTIFHRVIPNFMVQGGDPAGNGTGDPGYSFKDEMVQSLTFDRPGRLAMANSGPNTNGSQFFITEVPTPHLNYRHTIFGQCDENTMALVKRMVRMARDPRDDRPFRPVKINKITIVRGEEKPAAKPPASTPKS